ncbi:MAG: hypothetical protein KC656_13375 [Myxococcales bacterium]|nr:hypothetical protein [Myxococcales bacterium]
MPVPALLVGAAFASMLAVVIDRDRDARFELPGDDSPCDLATARHYFQLGYTHGLAPGSFDTARIERAARAEHLKVLCCEAFEAGLLGALASEAVGPHLHTLRIAARHVSTRAPAIPSDVHSRTIRGAFNEGVAAAQAALHHRHGSIGIQQAEAAFRGAGEHNAWKAGQDCARTLSSVG